MPRAEVARGTGRRSDVLWAISAAVIATFGVRGAFTASRLFFVRDLSVYLWPYHLWLRRTVWSGYLPLWDPYPGLGYAAHADPVLQIFFWPTLALRLLLPDVIGFNLSVALPYPVAALGTYVLLRMASSPPAAFMGSAAYAATGPTLSLASCPNQAWCAALLPWILVAARGARTRPSGPRIVTLAILVATSFLAGEPVAFALTMALGLAYCFVVRDASAARLRARAVGAGAIAVCALAAALASVQLLPLLDTTARSIRGAGLLLDAYSVHPAQLAEWLVPHAFGNYLGTPAEIGPWLAALNGGREPYLASLYVGVGVLALAGAGVVAGVPRRDVALWAVVTLASVAIALGPHAPLYPMLRELIPGAHLVRYPAKAMFLFSLGLAALAAKGWDALAAGERHLRRAGATAAAFTATVGLLGTLLWTTATLAPQAIAAPLTQAARALRVQEPALAASWMLASITAALPRLVALALGLALLFTLARRNPRARWVAVFLIVLDLLVVNRSLVPTMDAHLLQQPAWVDDTHAHPSDRVFVAQDLASSAPGDPDLPPRLALPASVPTVQVLAAYEALLPRFPSGWAIREPLSNELTGLRSREYLDAMLLYEAADREARTRFLRRCGTRYHVLPRSPAPEARLIRYLPQLEPLALYEDPAPSPRVSLVPQARIQPNVREQILRLFSADFDPAEVVWIEKDVPPAGESRGGLPAAATLVEDTPNTVTVRAQVPATGAFLLLLDGFDPNWHVTVDGQRAALVRANGLFRAVRLNPGDHVARFSYRPRSLWIGASLSALALIVSVAAYWKCRPSLESITT